MTERTLTDEQIERAYPHANVLGEGPNTSEKPGCRWRGAILVIGIEAAIVLACVIAGVLHTAWELWRVK